jgi:hypothetical protein
MEQFLKEQQDMLDKLKAKRDQIATDRLQKQKVPGTPNS